MLEYTVEQDEKTLRWEIVRWNTPVQGRARTGTCIEKFWDELSAREVCDFYNDRNDPTLWQDIGCEFDSKIV
jgi:hypothetical protein